MVETVKKRMSEWDWHVLGHDASDGSLPTRRLDVPIPETAEGLHEVAHQLGALSQEIARAARLSADAPTTMSHVHGLLGLFRNQFKMTRARWETELRERQQNDSEDEAPRGQIRAIG